MRRYIVTTTHELTPTELERAPKGLKRSSIAAHYASKREAVTEFEYKEQFLARLGFDDTLTLTSGNKVLRQRLATTTTKE